MSLVTLSLIGHLFDTKCFNKCIDICENNKIQFIVVGWEIGNVTKQSSQVSIQMMSQNKDELNDAIDQIQAVADTCGIELNFGN